MAQPETACPYLSNSLLQSDKTDLSSFYLICSFTNARIFFEEDLNISKKGNFETPKSTAHLEAQFVCQGSLVYKRNLLAS